MLSADSCVVFTACRRSRRFRLLAKREQRLNCSPAKPPRSSRPGRRFWLNESTMTTPLNAETDFGEVELRLDYVDANISSPHLDSDGVPVKAYRSYIDAWRASKDLCGRYVSDPGLKGACLTIKRR